MCTEAELLAWLGGAGLTVTDSSRSGPMFFFEAKLAQPGRLSGRCPGRAAAGRHLPC
jgi:hypothetical protein